MKRRIVSFVAALSVAVSSLICGAVTAGAETTKFDIVKEIKNVTIAEDTKLDTAMCGYYGLTSGGYTVFVSGLDTEKAAKIAETASAEGGSLEAVVVLDSGVGVGYTPKVHTAYVVKENYSHDEYVKGAELSLVGKKYKLTINVSGSISKELKSATRAAVSIRAVSGDTGKKVYYGDKKLYYVGFSDKDTSSTPLSDLTISSIGNKTYTGTAQKPDPVIKEGTYTLQKGKDYTLKYKNNVKIGTATVTIKGKGSYKGTRNVKFRIIPETTKIERASASYETATVYFKDVKGADTYHVYYTFDLGGTYIEAGTAKAGVGKISFKCPLGMSVYLRMRTSTTIDGKTYYSKYSKELLFTNQIAS